MIRVESEETQDDVRERRGYGDIGQEEVEEVDFVPSALSEPQGAAHWCDNQEDARLRPVRRGSIQAFLS